MTPQEIQSILQAYNINLTKKRGQHLLVNHQPIEEMIKAAKVSKNDIVIEVGPGLGVLTEALAEQAKQVLTIELDKKIIEVLKTNFLPHHKNVTLLEGDAIASKTFHAMVAWLYKQQAEHAQVDPKDESYKEILEDVDQSYKVVANLPYQITSKILRQFLESLPRPSQLVVMVQKEVAQRMAAQAGEMSLLSLAVQTASTAKIVSFVPAKDFFPPPEVDSAVIHCDLTKPNESFARLSEDEKKLFWRLAKLGYSSRRKQLKNNLQAFKGFEESMIEAIGLDPLVRAQELSVEDWCRLVEKVISNQ